MRACTRMGSFPLHSPSTASFHMRWSGHYTFDVSERALVRRSCCWILAAIADVLSRRAFSDAVRGRSRQCACISYIQQAVHDRVLCMLCVHSRFSRAGLCACFGTSSVMFRHEFWREENFCLLRARNALFASSHLLFICRPCRLTWTYSDAVRKHSAL